MTLDAQEIDTLTEALDVWDFGKLELLADDLGVNRNILAPGGSVKERAYLLISHLNRQLPPRDRELLEKLEVIGNARLKTVATGLLTPKFVSPTGDAHDAVLLGKVAFVARDDLRRALREFTNPSRYSTRVLIVRGDQPGGKSYSWQFLRHLAFQAVNAEPFRLRAVGIETPRELLRQALELLGLNASALPVLADDPQLAKVNTLLVPFKAQIPTLTRRIWLVIDDLNDRAVIPPIREMAFAMAQAVEELKPENLWLALLGYNEAIVDPELRYAALDDAEFPNPRLVAAYLKTLADMSPKTLTQKRAEEIAEVMFSAYAKLDKEAMTRLTVSFEQMGAKLLKGMQP